MNKTLESDGDRTEFDSRDSILVMSSGPSLPPEPLTPPMWLSRMRWMVQNYGYPLPPKFVRPPGIDFDALLRQVPWPPSADQHPAQDEQQPG
jgi:hypothetical protein